MPTLLPRRLRLLLCLLLPASLLGSCHSTQPAFSFRPAPTVTAAPAEAAPDSAVAATQPGPPPQARPAPRRQPRSAAASVPTPVQPARLRTAPLRQRLLPRPVARHQAARRPADEGHRPHDTFHIILGGVLIVGSVLVGLWLGGWLGLGVGAAIMLLGDYFLVLGIGGKHAWLEIFQEFFNM